MNKGAINKKGLVPGLSMDRTDAGTPGSKERIGMKEARRTGRSRGASGVRTVSAAASPGARGRAWRGIRIRARRRPRGHWRSAGRAGAPLDGAETDSGRNRLHNAVAGQVSADITGGPLTYLLFVYRQRHLNSLRRPHTQHTARPNPLLGSTDYATTRSFLHLFKLTGTAVRTLRYL
jgi:hypothetical protein